MTDNALRGAGGGGGGGSQHTPTESPDSLKSTALARIVDIIAEGELGGFHHGLANALQDIYLNETRVMNADNSLNFQNVQIDSRTGTADQSFMPGFPDTENEIAVNVELRNTANWTQTISNLADTSARVTLGVPQLLKSNASTGDIGDYSIAYAIDLQTDAGSFVTIVSSAIKGKTTSKYQKSHTFALPHATTGWTIKVRRLTANLNLATTQDTMTIDSYAEIEDVKVRYSNLAAVGIILDSAQFTSIPSRSYDLYGRIISVPSNYNPTTRVYTGVWDGTFKPAWTNNPAWIYYDAITNDRFGLGNRINAALVNKWTLYTIAQYCDGMVSDLKGGTEPRFTAFIYQQAQTDAATFLNNLTSIFRGIAYWAGGSIQASADMPGAVDYIYTPANVIDGYFKYEGSQRKTRYTVAQVEWNDPADFGRIKTAYVPDRAGIARYGIRPISIKASGATSIGQAIRMGLWTLYTSRLDDQTCTFKVGLDGALSSPGAIIGIADPAKAGKRMGGRIHSATTTAITVDLAPDLGAAGDTMTCAMPSGITEAHPITSIVGNVITVSGAFSVAPNVEAMWYVDAVSLKAATYRVISVAEPGSSEALAYTITALAHNESKFAAVDIGLPITVDPTVYNAATTIAGPPAVALSSHVVTGNAMLTSVLDIAWDVAPGASGYDLQYRSNLGGWVMRDNVQGLLLSIPGMSPGVYEASVRARSPSGGRSQPVSAASYTLPDPTQLPVSISNLNTEVAAAQASATLANAELDNIASDNILSPAEKPTVIRDYSVITTEQAGIDSQAVSFLGAASSQQVAYDNAITALTNYLATLTTTKAWNDKTGDTTVVGATFRSNFNTVYTTRQTLLNAIYASAKSKADAAQGTANNAAPAYVINPGFDLLPAGTGWNHDPGWTFPQDSAGPGAGAGYAKFTPTGANAAIYNQGKLPVILGQTVKAQALIRAAGANGVCYARIRWLDSTGAQIALKSGNTVTGSTTTGSYAVDQAPANALYAAVMIEVDSCTVGTYAVDNVVMTLMPTNQSEVPNGGGHNSVTGIDGNGLALIDFTQLGHVSKNADNIADGTTYGRTVNSYLNGNRPRMDFADTWHSNKTQDYVADGATYGRISTPYINAARPVVNLADTFHGGKTLANIADTAARFAAVTAYADNTSNAVQLSVANPNFELGDINWVHNSSVSIPLNSGGAFQGSYSIRHSLGSTNDAAINSTRIPVSTGQVWKITCKTEGYGASNGTCGIGFAYYDASGTILGIYTGATVTGSFSYKTQESVLVIPANAVTASVAFQYLGHTDSNAYQSDMVQVFMLASSVDDIPDGTTYARIYGSELTSGRHKLTVAGSGLQVGDQRNLMPILTAGAQAMWQNLTISATSAAGTPATATISVSAAQIIGLIASGGLVSYNASSGGVTGTGGTAYTYYLYYLDQTLTGGTQTLQITTTPNTLRGQLGVVYIGSITFTYPTSGTYTPPPGGGGLCVTDDMWINDALQAGDAVPGDIFDCVDWPTGQGKHQRPLLGVTRGTEECVRIMTDGGAELDCSISTPFDLPDGRTVLAPDMLGEFVLTDRGLELVNGAEPIGRRNVSRIHLGGISYAAGVDPTHRIYSHNGAAKP
jgi:predicted phage tail protein